MILEDGGVIDRLPYGWEVVQIGQVADLINGYSQFNSESYVDNGIPIFRIGDLGGQIDLSGVKRVSEDVVPNLNQKRLFRGDILIAKIGKRVGASSVYNFDEPAILSSQVAGIRAKRIEQKFLAYFIESSFFYNAIKPHFFGSTRDNISPNQIKLTSILFPPLPTQQKIAAVLGAYDDLIENNTRRIKILEEMVGAIYRQWFVEFRFPGHESVEMVESELGLMPQGWEVKQLGEMCYVTMGLSPKSEFYNETDDGLPFHQGVTDFGKRFPTDRIYCTIQKRVAEIDDILFSVRAPVGRINIANKKIVIGRGLSAIRSKEGNQTLLFQQLKDRFQEEDTMGSGTIFNAIRKADLLEVPLLIPTKSVISKFEEIANPIFVKLVNLTMKNQNLCQTRDLFAPQTDFRGA